MKRQAEIESGLAKRSVPAGKVLGDDEVSEEDATRMCRCGCGGEGLWANVDGRVEPPGREGMVMSCLGEILSRVTKIGNIHMGTTNNTSSFNLCPKKHKPS
jgi:hypothetical protein